MPNGSAAKGASPFEIVTPGKPKKATNKGLIVGVLVVLFLILSVVAGVLLVRQQQDVRERAQTANQCPAAEACPVSGQPNRLLSCHPAEGDGTPAESLCNAAGRVEFCGTRNYCCPAAGAAWTTNMSACATPTPTATATATASPTATATATPTATGTPRGTATPGATPTRTPTPTATAAAQTTPRAIPVTGTDWPTIVGAGVGVFVIIASILIAL